MIRVEGLTRYYGTLPAVRDVSFSIDDQVIVGFLGLNGAGKSTVLKILGGLLPPSAGEVEVGGVDVTQAPDSHKKQIGFLPEEPPLYLDMRVGEFLTWCGELKGMSRAQVEKRLPEVIELCDLQGMENRVIETLSHGYRKRVGIAQAIVHDPDLVILDEPISGLDPVQIVEMRDVLRKLKGSCTILVSSHILSEISQTCDRIMVLHEGEIVAEGSEEELGDRLRRTAPVSLTLRGGRADIERTIAAFDRAVGHKLEQRGDYIRAEVALDGDAREELVAALVAAGIGIRRVEEAESGLESVFLGLTTRDEALDARDGSVGTTDELETQEEE